MSKLSESSIIDNLKIDDMILSILKQLAVNFISIFSELKPTDKSEKKVLLFSFIYFAVIAILFLISVGNNSLVELMGYDTYSYIDGDNPRLSLFKVLKWEIKHPLFCLLYTPVLALSKLVGFLGIDIHWYLFILFSSAIMSFCLMLLFKILRQLNVSLFNSYLMTLFFGSFSYVILLSVQAESFLLVLFFTLLFLVITLKKKTNIYTDNLFFFLLVGTTSTNSLKILASDFILEKRFIKSVKRFLVSLPLFAIVFVFTSLGMFYRHFIMHLNWHDAIISDVLAYTLTTINKFTLFWVNFLSEPLLFHSTTGVIYGEETIKMAEYSSGFYQPALAFIYLMVVLSVILNRKEVISKIGIAFIGIDLLIHFGIGYGVNEAQLFSAHWFFFIPILLGLLVTKLTNKYLKTTVQLGIGTITILFFIHNLYCFINSLIW